MTQPNPETTWGNCLLMALLARIRDPRVRIRWMRNRKGRWHCYWETPAGKFEFYGPGASARSYLGNLWYRGWTKRIGSA